MGGYLAYTEYKDSEIEWLGKIPTHWQLKKLHHVARLRSGETMTAQMMNENDEFPVYGGNGLRGYFSSYTHDGDYVLIGRQGALCGNINYASGKFWASEHAVVVSPSLDLETFWLGELLRIMNLNQYSTSAAQPGISVEQIGRLKIPFPSIEEQRAIAQFLDYKTSQIDALITKKETLLEKLSEKRTALISEAVTKGCDRTVPMKDSGVEWIGEIPTHWNVLQIKRAFVLQRGVDITKEEQVEGKIPVVSSGGVLSYHDTAYAKAPGVVIGRKGTLGKVHYIEQDYWPHDTTLYVINFYTNYPRFIYYKLLSMELETWDTGSANPTLNRNLIHPVKTPWPPVEEQVKIVNYLDSATTSINQQSQKINLAINKLKEYRTALITNAVTGKIDVRDIKLPEVESVEAA